MARECTTVGVIGLGSVFEPYSKSIRDLEFEGLLETTVLNLAQASLTSSNGLTCPDPGLRILTPLTGQAYIAGETLQIIGTAEYPGARRYQLEYRPAGNSEWKLINRPKKDVRLDLLAEWDTTGLTVGSYEVRLSPVDMNNIRLANSSPCTIIVNLIEGSASRP